MSTTTATNGKPHRRQLADEIDRIDKQLGERLDRLDSILDALADGLNQAVADACREGTRQAVKDVLLELFPTDNWARLIPRSRCDVPNGRLLLPWSSDLSCGIPVPRSAGDL